MNDNVTRFPPQLRPIAAPVASVMRPVYSGFLAAQIRRVLLEGGISPEATGLNVDQFQSNGMYACHQLRVTLPDGMGTYRVIVAPADAPVSIGGVSAEEHFLEPLIPPPVGAA